MEETKKVLWICGKTVGISWEFQGVFDTKEQAAACCKDLFYFIAPIELNFVVPDETTKWEGIEHPLAEEVGDNWLKTQVLAALSDLTDWLNWMIAAVKSYYGR